jgi:hypothetical protein
VALRESAMRQPEPVAKELSSFPDVLPFATPAAPIICRQGAHSYLARQLAYREGRLLFIDPRTRQLGIARLQGGEGVDARQYPDAGIAVIMFLGSLEAIDAD